MLIKKKETWKRKKRKSREGKRKRKKKRRMKTRIRRAKQESDEDKRQFVIYFLYNETQILEDWQHNFPFSTSIHEAAGKRREVGPPKMLNIFRSYYHALLLTLLPQIG